MKLYYQVHQIGLEEVETILEDGNDVIKRLGFNMNIGFVHRTKLRNLLYDLFKGISPNISRKIKIKSSIQNQKQ